MARSNEYTHKRFVTMQIVMWGVLVLTVGLAALASSYQRGAAVVKLGEPRKLETVSVRVPKSWKISQTDDSITAVERSGDPMWRREIIIRERDPSGLSMMEWLMEGATASPAQPGKNVNTIPMGSAGEGRLDVRVLEEDRRIGIRRLQVTVRAVLPNKKVLTIALTCFDEDGRDEPDAKDLVKDIAASVEMIAPTK